MRMNIMDKFFIKRPRSEESSNTPKVPLDSKSSEENINTNFNFNDIVSNPGLRKPIKDFDIGIRDQVRREYLTRGPCQPIGHKFPQKDYSKQKRSFQDAWFKQHPWLEYSITKDAAFCFWCYLFKPKHIGVVNSLQNDARVKFQGFQSERQSVSHLLATHSHEMEVAYRIRLMTVLDVTRFLLKQGLPFRGNDESSNSLNKGNFLELLEWYSLRNEEVWKIVNQNAPGNNQLTFSKIQKELANACAIEITRVIIDDIGDSYFSLMIDEARDASVKQQMINKNGHNAIDCLFAKHKLSLLRLRGQGYDGASNMRGEFNGLKALILRENPYARYVHYFAHQLQLVIVVVAKDNRIVSDFFQYVNMIVNATGASCKRRDQLQQHHHDRLVDQLEKVEIVSGKGKNQESSLVRPGDTRWGSHYTIILQLICMWTSILEVLQNVYDDGASSDNRGIVASLIDKMENYKFLFVMYLMRRLLGMKNELSLALQQKDQNIVQAMRLIEVVKTRLQHFRETGWEEFLGKANSFCKENSIDVPNMEDNMPIRGCSRREGQFITHFHHYRVEIFCEVIDLISQEMHNRFPKASTELLLLISCLDPRDSFSKFNIHKLLRLAEMYPEDFSMTERMMLKDQLATFIYDVRHDDDFANIGDLGGFAMKMVDTDKCAILPLVYHLIELALVLPVATARVERPFLAMNVVKTDLRNKMGDEWMNDSMIVYIEKEVFATIDNETILQCFQKMQTRYIQLPPLSSMRRTDGSSSSSVHR
ncbi:P-loop containing nucleoside triphosphate hydrolase protein [Dioscorea alata]|uniref:P-loop containing nucleoside triphosphate hydrolase protein n=1 Tax=Dioscorea alata TaxID=55571 RepID=A0ACB7WL18_DIOAL|nr:P-loop containing nucleoside triphosphate hydrolase protein [Dioscorea alata]